MLSGNGRHRRPRQAPAILVAAGVTSSAIAIPLLGAGAASAADGATWDRIADCETGGSWSQNTGNGYYGGLQLTQDAWERYGGLDYASSPDQASRGQQIAVAEAILADQGVEALSLCGMLAGLNGNGSAQDTDQEPSGSSDASVRPDAGETPATELPSVSLGSTPGLGEGTAGSEGVGGSGQSVAPSQSSGGVDRTEGGDTVDSDEGEDVDVDVDVSVSPSSSATPNGDPSDSVTPTDRSSQGGSEGTGRHRGIDAGEGGDDERAPGGSGRHAAPRGLDVWSGAGGAAYTPAETGNGLASLADSPALGDELHALHTVSEQLIGAHADVLPGQ